MKKIYYLFLILLLTLSSYGLKAQVLASDSLALVDFYNAAGGPNWTSQGNWLTGNVSTWIGVTVTNNRVTKLEVSLNNMVGTVSPSIGNLTELTALRLQGDEANKLYVDLHGALPDEIYNCTKLTLIQLKFTKLTTWTNRDSIYKLNKLVEFNTQATMFGGTLPDSLFTIPTIQKLYLHSCNYVGAVPSTITKATKLTRFYVWGGSKLTSLPYVDITNKGAAKLELYGNFFSFADIKPYADSSAKYAGYSNGYQFTQDTVVISKIAGTKLVMHGATTNGEGYAWFKDAGTTSPTGTPVATDDSLVINSVVMTDTGVYTCVAQSSMVANFSILTVYKLKVVEANTLESDSLALVDFYNAAGGPNWTYQGNWLTGDVSTWSGVTVTNGRVTKLEVSMNNMVGTVSPSIGNLTELTVLRLQGDEANKLYVDLHGALPDEIYNCTKLTLIQLKFTRLTSWTNRDSIYKLNKLVEFNTQATMFGGTLPDSLFTIPTIQKLYLHSCNYVGAVPSTITKATKLTRFYVFGGSKLTSLPYVNITNKGAAKLELYGNFFSFKDIKPYADSSAKYAGYSNGYQFTQDTIPISIWAGKNYTMHGAVADGEGYAWFKDAGTTSPAGTPIATDDSLVINSASIADSGVYTCVSQSSMVPNFNILSVYKLNVMPFNLKSDSLALVDFYNAAGGPNWTSQGNWLTGDVSTWSGVTVTNGRVTKLEVSMNNMVGTVTPSIGNLTELTALRLMGDETNKVYVDLHGALPNEIYNCTKLTLIQLKFTKLTTWTDRDSIYKLNKLVEFNTQATMFGGTLPDSLFTIPTIQKLYLHSCNYVGAVPSTITKATNLTRFYVFGGSKLTSLPYVDITNKGAAKLELYGNYFSFADVKPYALAHAATPYAGYSNAYQFAQDTVIVSADERTSYKFSLKVTGGEGYAWFKDDATTPVATDSTFTIASLALTDAGTYTCKVQSSLVPNFEIRAAFNLNVNEVALVAPVLSTAASNENGTKISLTFDKAMANPSASAASFTVKVNGTAAAIKSVTLDAGNKKVVIVELTEAVMKDDVILLSYTGTDVKAEDGGVLGVITDKSVTNNSIITGIANPQITFTTFPNPFTDKLLIRSTVKVDYIGLYDVTGKMILELKNINESVISLPVSNLRQGVYLVSVKSANATLVQKIVKK